jgi:hypothetical protein
MAWGKLWGKYGKRTDARAMRLLSEVLYPKKAKMEGLAVAVMAWEAKWDQMEKEEVDAEGRPLRLQKKWKMMSMMKLCPKEIEDMIELRWDEMWKMDYMEFKESVLGWTAEKMERSAGGAVPMDIGNAEDDEGYGDESGWGYEEEAVDAVTRNTRCYYCQGYGHFARDCPKKGGGKVPVALAVVASCISGHRVHSFFFIPPSTLVTIPFVIFRVPNIHRHCSTRASLHLLRCPPQHTLLEFHVVHLPHLVPP